MGMIDEKEEMILPKVLKGKMIQFHKIMSRSDILL